MSLLNIPARFSGYQTNPDKYIMGLMLIIFTTKRKDPPKKLKQYIKGLESTYWKVFNNNNDKLLTTFFKDPFLLDLWRQWSLHSSSELV